MNASPEPDVLRRIAAQRRKRLGRRLEARPDRGATADRGRALSTADNGFLAALAARRGRAVIAEIKMGSPRLGSLAGRVDPLAQSSCYADNGAAALSVVVEPDFFGGSYELLSACRRQAGLPALAKDFVVDRVQLAWAQRAGADAVLLIAALLDGGELWSLAAEARSLGIVPLVEIHDAPDVEKLGQADWELTGINHRDLRTFDVDLGRSRELLPRLPARALKVAESGISTPEEIRRLRGSGFDAFLVGESLLLAEDPAAKLRQLADA